MATRSAQLYLAISVTTLLDYRHEHLITATKALMNQQCQNVLKLFIATVVNA